MKLIKFVLLLLVATVLFVLVQKLNSDSTLIDNIPGKEEITTLYDELGIDNTKIKSLSDLLESLKDLTEKIR